MASPGALTVLGIDPALTVTGYGVIVAEGDRYRSVHFGFVAPPVKAPLPERLYRIHEALTDVIREFRPDEVAVEDFITGFVRAAHAGRVLDDLILPHHVDVRNRGCE